MYSSKCVINLNISCYSSSTLFRDTIHECYIIQCIEGLTKVPPGNLVEGLKAFIEKWEKSFSKNNLFIIIIFKGWLLCSRCSWPYWQYIWVHCWCLPYTFWSVVQNYSQEKSYEICPWSICLWWVINNLKITCTHKCNNM